MLPVTTNNQRKFSIQQFKQNVVHSFHSRTRESMPWRKNPSPYHVLVSEFMLQQTQVSRVVSYFNAFIAKWKNIECLSKASLSAVLKEWQGLGYNRRAKFLHNCAKQIVKEYNASIPSNKEALQRLPGIGEYTSAAILVFAFNSPCVVVETNIRRAILYAFFPHQTEVTESEVRLYVEKTMDKENPRQWYWGLMDYGYWLKFEVVNPNRRSKEYKKQTNFIGSTRQIRGAIVRILSKHKHLGEDELYRYVELDLVSKRNIEDKEYFVNETKLCLERLKNEGLLVSEKERWYLAK